MADISKHDWKLFQEKLPIWQEAYMDRLCKEYVELLTSDVKAAERFQELEERIKKDRKRPGVIISVDKSNMIFDVLRLLRDEAISMQDLDGFTEDFRKQIQFLLNMR